MPHKYPVWLCIIVSFMLLVVTPAKASPDDEPTVSVTDNNLVSIGIYPNTEQGIANCFDDLDAGRVVFYQPVDTRGYRADARTNALEDNTCARMRVRGGLKGVVALRQGSLVNLGVRDGREQPVAYNACNNWLELVDRPAHQITQRAVTVSQTPTPPAQNIVVPQSRTDVSVTPTNTETEVVDTVTVRRRVVVRYVDEVVYETPPQVNVTVPPTEYRYTVAPRQSTYTSSSECICYRPNGYTGPLYQYLYPNGQRFCVPPQMGDSTVYPPGYGPNQ